MAKRKLKKKVKLFLLIFVIILIIAIILCSKAIKTYRYHQTYEYKLLEKKYSMDDIKIITNKLSNEQIDDILNKDYIANLTNFVNEKYFIYKNLDRYLDYQSKNKKVDYSKIIAYVNTNRDYKYYEEVKETDITKDTLMLVNKYNYLPEDYVPENLVNVSLSYAYEGNVLRKDIIEVFISMCNKAKDDGINLILNSSYRPFADQKEIWEYRKNVYGREKADNYAARAGYSEHQTGLALDINEYKSSESDFEKTKAFAWLQENAYKYGFILRYPKDAEDITGYSYESWHYRYVGVDIATKINEEHITFDEYYAFYIENK